MADIQINATGGEFTEQTSIQIRRGSTITDFPPVDDDVEQLPARDEEEVTETEILREGQPIVPSSRCEDPLHYEDPVMQISGAGHWFLEGWIGDHSVEFLVDSGSSVTAMSNIFYRNLVHAGAPLGALQVTARTLRSANGTGIEVLGCSRCSRTSGSRGRTVILFFMASGSQDGGKTWKTTVDDRRRQHHTRRVEGK